MNKVLVLFALLGSNFYLHTATVADDAPSHRRILLEPFKPAGEKIPVLFLDADSTLRVARSGSVSANSSDDYVVLPFTPALIKQYVDQGYLVAIVSNQEGVSWKIVSFETADAALFNVVKELKNHGATVHYLDFATEVNEDRKPGKGMFLRLERKLKDEFGDRVAIDLEKSLMVGDSDYKKTDKRPDGRDGFAFSNSDRLFAEAVGINFVPPEIFFGWKTFGVERIDTLDDFIRFSSFLAPSCQSVMEELRVAETPLK